MRSYLETSCPTLKVLLHKLLTNYKREKALFPWQYPLNQVIKFAITDNETWCDILRRDSCHFPESSQKERLWTFYETTDLNSSKPPHVMKDQIEIEAEKKKKRKKREREFVSIKGDKRGIRTWHLKANCVIIDWWIKWKLKAFKPTGATLGNMNFSLYLAMLLHWC